MKKEKLYGILFYIFTAEGIGALSALIAGNFSDFFLKYEKPPLLPPQWLFPVVWTVLFALMGYSAYLISRADEPKDVKKNALTVYWLQLGVFNFLWSILFFRFELLWVGFADIVLLLISVCAMTVMFFRIKAQAGWLNVPYVIWVAFASYLNLATALIN
ncbi:MAG: tryptophan-rich sensory protein [Ruminococcaceae bacterium]|nr:tryptophan-rich sensory protein [Oscillospiraceae bacterium]